jgi:biotin operon repressor
MVTPELIVALSKAVPSRAFKVWVYLWTRADRQTGETWPSGKTISAELEIGRGHVSEDISRLESAGWLQIERAAGTLNKYRVTTPQQVDAETGIVGSGGVLETGIPPVLETGRGVSSKREEHPNTTKNTTKEHKKESRDSLSLEKLVSCWNQIEGVEGCRKITANRRRAFRARTREAGWLDDVPEALQRIGASSFCRGRNDRGWRAGIDWFLRPDTLTKILEGKYTDRNGNGQPRRTPEPFVERGLTPEEAGYA